MGRKEKCKRKNSLKKNWKISEKEKQMFLEALESLEIHQEDLAIQKFDLIEEKPFKIRRRKSSFQEPGERIKATLDLHGFWREEAITRLALFCQQSSGQGIRTVLIITGKGIHSNDLKPILKREVIQWLNSEKGRQLVEFYRLGSRQEGGKGALILYLY